MVVNGWLGIKYVAGGQTFMTVLLNSFVHGIMYAYYGLSAMGPSVRKFLWWKKYLTQLQLVQFAIIVVHAIVGIRTGCSYPQGYSMAFVGYGVIFTLLFSSFYLHSYKSAGKRHHHHSHHDHVKANGNGTHHAKVNGHGKHD
jgi:elongation of very long chain fatty acids protein 4